VSLARHGHGGALGRGIVSGDGKKPPAASWAEKIFGNWKRSWKEKRWKLLRSGRRSRNMIPSAAPSTSNYARDIIHRLLESPMLWASRWQGYYIEVLLQQESFRNVAYHKMFG
jgi:hypothetical protein